jgi:hypothetical protein
MLTYGIVLLDDNAFPLVTARTRTLPEHFNWELFGHSPYSLDLASSDYHLFTHLKYWLESWRFDNNEELVEGFKTWLTSDGRLVGHRHRKTYSLMRQCLNSGGHYVEK